jgi:hypothetical protein
MRRFRRAIAAALAITLLPASAALADLKTDLDLATSGEQRNADLGATLVGGETYTVFTSVYYQSGAFSEVTFESDLVPDFVTSATGDRIVGSGSANAVTSTITLAAPCTLGEFGELGAGPTETAVTYKWTEYVRAQGSGDPSDSFNDDAYVNVRGSVSELGPNCEEQVSRSAAAAAVANEWLDENGPCTSWGTNKNKNNWRGQLISAVAQAYSGYGALSEAEADALVALLDASCDAGEFVS